ncbi:MAG: hypothetical protein K0R14_704 [Burkholderiales bacterium]|jgi:hypothetical protein|nr:hypothetical protein [Burkholderiales bacterium]
MKANIIKIYLLNMFIALFFCMGNAIAGQAGLYYVPIEENDIAWLEKIKGLQISGQNIVIKWRLMDNKALTLNMSSSSPGQQPEFSIDLDGKLGSFTGFFPNNDQYGYTFKRLHAASGTGWLFTLFRLEVGQDGTSNKHIMSSTLTKQGTELYDLPDEMTPQLVEAKLVESIQSLGITDIPHSPASHATTVRARELIMSGACQNYQDPKDYFIYMRFYENGTAMITRDPHGRFEYRGGKGELIKGKGLQTGYLTLNKAGDIADANFPRIDEMPEVTLIRSAFTTGLLNREVKEKWEIITVNTNGTKVNETLKCGVTVFRKQAAASLVGKTTPEIVRIIGNADSAKPLSVKEVSAKTETPIMSGSCKRYPYSKDYLFHMKFYADGIAMITGDSKGRFLYKNYANELVEGKGLRIGQAMLNGENNISVANFPKLGKEPKISLIRREFKTDTTDKSEQEWWEVVTNETNKEITTEIVQCDVVKFEKKVAGPSEGKASSENP